MTNENPKVEFYWGSGSPFVWRAMLALELKGIPYESHRLEFSKNEHKAPEFLAINPRGKVPALRHGAVVMRESLAIMAYLERAFPTPPLFGKTPAEAARIWQAVAEADYYFEPLMGRIAVPILFGKLDGKIDDANDAAKAIHEELGRVEETLDGNRWLAGDTVSAADIFLYPMLMLLLRAADKEDARKRLDLGLLPFEPQYPSIAAWMKAVEGLPGYDRTYPPHWR